MRIPFVLLTAVSLIAALSGCGKKNAASVTTETPSAEAIIVQLDWVAEPEHGGFYQAQARGYFKDAGLEVTLIPGGPNAFGTQKVATGQAHFAQADSTNTLLAIEKGLPVIHVAAVFQNDPSVLMLHAENPVTRFEDLNGKTVMARPEWAFIPYVKKKYGIDFQLIPQNFSVGNFIADKNFIQQGFYIAEPFHIIKGGAKPPRFLYAWDAGFDAYTVVIGNKTWLAKNPEKARAFLKAYIRGWQDYLEGDPTPAHEAMKKANTNNTDDFLAFSRKMIIDEKLVIGRQNGSAAQIGRIAPERFEIQINQLHDLGILKNKLAVPDVMTTAYLP
jgi:NitT/TauT family transport system substrate-binding protein